MTIKNRLQKLEQQTAHTCPTCQHPYDAQPTAGIRERLMQRLLNKGYSEEEAQEIFAEAEKRAREYAL